jgi:hypothetical protein
MDLSSTLAFVAIAFTLIAIPGADWAFVLAAGARDHVVVPPVAGILLGYALVSAVVVAGFAALVTTFPAALLLTTVAGAGYLTYLGVKVLRGSAKITRAGGQAPLPSTLRSFSRGVGGLGGARGRAEQPQVVSVPGWKRQATQARRGVIAARSGRCCGVGSPRCRRGCACSARSDTR